MRIYPYNELSRADLIIDAVYEGAPGGKLSGEALGKLLPVGNQGGFRAAGSRGNEKLVSLFTSGDDPDWPDTLDVNTGQFIYYGDNKRPGHTLHDTARGGNKLLRLMFERIHSQPTERNKVPPCFVFRKYATPVSARSFQFSGIGCPGISWNATDLRSRRRMEDGRRAAVSELPRQLDTARRSSDPPVHGLTIS